MIVTNKKNLPDAIVQAVKNDYYSKGDAKFSVTGLLQPPQVRRLMALNYDKLTTDVADEIWKLFGSAVHHILDRGEGKTDKQAEAEIKMGKIALEFELRIKDNKGDRYPLGNNDFMQKIYEIVIGREDVAVEDDHIVREKRLYLTVGDIVISGATDRYDKFLKKIEDYKVTTVYKVTKGDHSDWEAQLNVYALLLINAGYPVDTLQLNAILKDYSRRDAIKASQTKDNEYFPDSPVASLQMTLWKPLDTLKWVIEKIEDQMSVEEMTNPEEIAHVRPCSLEDKWQKPATYALMKEGGKRASALFKTFAEANGASINKGKGYFVETRAGYPIRCEEYCLVKDFCAQYKKDNTTEVTFKEIQGEALKKLEEVIPDSKQTELDIDKLIKEEKVETVETITVLAVDKEEIPAIPEIIKPKQEDLTIVKDLLSDL